MPHRLARNPPPALPLQPLASSIRMVVLLWGEPSEEAKQRLAGRPALSFQDVLDRGSAALDTFQPAALEGGDVATLVYTSGTTGHPKVRPSAAGRGRLPEVLELHCSCYDAEEPLLLHSVPVPAPPMAAQPQPARRPHRAVLQAVALTHANLLSQMLHFDFFIPVQPGDRTLSLLPPWHM